MSRASSRDLTFRTGTRFSADLWASWTSKAFETSGTRLASNGAGAHHGHRAVGHAFGPEYPNQRPPAVFFLTAWEENRWPFGQSKPFILWLGSVSRPAWSICSIRVSAGRPTGELPLLLQL